MRTAILLTLVALAAFTACTAQIEQPAPEQAAAVPDSDIQDIEGQLDDIDALDQELDTSDLDGIDQDLAQI